MALLVAYGAHLLKVFRWGAFTAVVICWCNPLSLIPLPPFSRRCICVSAALLMLQVDLPIKQFPISATWRGRLALLIVATVPALLAYLKRSHYPVDYRQGAIVNKALSYEHFGGNWSAADEWKETGRAQMVAFLRQRGLATEQDVDETKLPWMIGFAAAMAKINAGDSSKVKNLQKRIDELETELKELTEHSQSIAESLKTENRRLAGLLSANQISKREENPLNSAYEEQMRGGDTTIEELMRQRGWVRIGSEPAEQSYDDKHVSSFVEIESLEPDKPESDDFGICYRQLQGDERNAEMILMKAEGMSYKEIAELFGVPVGTVKSIINRSKT